MKHSFLTKFNLKIKVRVGSAFRIYIVIFSAIGIKLVFFKDPLNGNEKFIHKQFKYIFA